MSQLWDEEEVLLWSSGTVPQPVPHPALSVRVEAI